MVRDDFWLAVSRFMQELEIRLIEGENSRLVDLFDPRHARKVLAAMGHAYGALPEVNRSAEQDQFLDQAVAGLAQDGKVVPVRLSLFAEMVKGKPWTPSVLRDIGGAEGVGVAFLEETFSSPSAPPHHKLQQKAAQAVLAALLPDAGSDIRGHMRASAELLTDLEKAGCKTSPSQFEEITALLDHELRLVSPADTESADADSKAASPLRSGSKSYQLTHDYLVPSLRTWLTRKQTATRRGRAELRLADFASLWSARPENRRLPSLLEFLQIRFNTSPKTWNGPQRNMMRVAGRLHGLRCIAVILLVAVIAVSGYEFYGRYRANALREELYSAEFNRVPIVLEELASYQRWAVPSLRRDFDEATKNLQNDKDDEAKTRDNRTRLRASLALLPSDDGQTGFLYDCLIAAAPEEVDTIRGSLLTRERKLPVATLEAQADEEVSGHPGEPKYRLITERKAHAAIALLLLKHADKVWPFFKNGPDETVRSYLIHWSRSLKVDPQMIAGRLDQEKDAGARSSLLLLLGELPDSALRDGQQRQLIADLMTTLKNDPDSGLHGAAQWLLRKWNCDDKLKKAVEQLGTDEAQRMLHRTFQRQRWYVNRQGQTFVIVDAKQPFTMGSPESEHGPDIQNERQHSRTINRLYAICASPVTVAQFRRFLADRKKNGSDREAANAVAVGNCPQVRVTWYDAAEYCNWLSRIDGISPDQWCYEANKRGEFAAEMHAKNNYLKLTGYRLPTEAEWEFACRAGTKTRFFCGEDDGVLGDYAWYENTSRGHPWPVTYLKPNDFGLFDMHGNVWQWCDWPWLPYPAGPEPATEDDECKVNGNVINGLPAPLRGGAYDNLSRRLRSAFRTKDGPGSPQPSFGFRPARTIVLPGK
jgi:formylglycine-generating enzyme required for sulfatase activity